MKPNTFAVAFVGTAPIEKRVVTLADGTICFSSSMTAAKRDLAQFIREYRASGNGCTARRLNDGGTAFYFRKGLSDIGQVQIVRLDYYGPTEKQPQAPL